MAKLIKSGPSCHLCGAKMAYGMDTKGSRPYYRCAACCMSAPEGPSCHVCGAEMWFVSVPHQVDYYECTSCKATTKLEDLAQVAADEVFAERDKEYSDLPVKFTLPVRFDTISPVSLTPAQEEGLKRANIIVGGNKPKPSKPPDTQVVDFKPKRKITLE